MIRAMHVNDSTTGRSDATVWGATDFSALGRRIKDWARELGFAAPGFSGVDVSAASPHLWRWLELCRHGEMHYMAKHADISRYALGRDYHKTLRRRLQALADRMQADLDAAGHGEHFVYRAFSDSAPVLEVELARQAGIAWRGKHTLALTRAGSWHFLGDIYCNLPLPPDDAVDEHCGTCRRCLDACPTGAIVAPYEVDARLCISYLTIELHGSIPVALRPLIGNRIYGCDDCQLCCPWNRFAALGDPAFAVRHALDATPLATLFAWNEDEFEARLAGSPIRRIGHERWLRNIAVALGNGGDSPGARAALAARRAHPSPVVREHVNWALAQISGRHP